MNSAQNPVAESKTFAGDAQRPELEPVFFGPSRELFGCLHAPLETPQSGQGIVICSAAGPEYIRCHRSLRVLAALFSRAGFPVLRFDYFGTGDSVGEGEEATLARWLADVGQAVRHMRGRYRVTRLTLFGVRIGAALALRYMLDRGGVDRLVLWDPVVDGRQFVDEIRQRTAEHERWLGERHGTRPASIPADGPRDLFGFRYSQSMIEELAAIDLLSLQVAGGADAYILDNCEDEKTAALARNLRECGMHVDFDQFEASRVWLAEPFQGLVSAQSLKRIDAWVTGNES
jgi:pimeloyl-ACP methyl ester carboxylesterase